MARQLAREKASTKLAEAAAAADLPLLREAVAMARAAGMEGHTKEGRLWRFEAVDSAVRTMSTRRPRAAARNARVPAAARYGAP